MGIERSVACSYYECEGICGKGRKKCRFYHEMQNCNLYRPIKGGRPARKNLKKEKEDKFMKDWRNFE